MSKNIYEFDKRAQLHWMPADALPGSTGHAEDPRLRPDDFLREANVFI